MKNNNIRCLKLFMNYLNIADVVLNYFLCDVDRRCEIAEELGFEGTRKGRLFNIFCAEKVDIDTFKSFISTLEYNELKRKPFDLDDLFSILVEEMKNSDPYVFIRCTIEDRNHVLTKCSTYILTNIDKSVLKQAIEDNGLNDQFQQNKRDFIDFLVSYMIFIKTPKNDTNPQPIPTIVLQFVGPKGKLEKKYVKQYKAFRSYMRLF